MDANFKFFQILNFKFFQISPSVNFIHLLNLDLTRSSWEKVRSNECIIFEFEISI